MKTEPNLQIDFISKSTAQTSKLCAYLFHHLPSPALVSLTGPLGAGKTQIAKFLAQNFGALEPLISSSFLKARLYYNQKNEKLLHIDSYNTKSIDEVWFFLQEHLDAHFFIIEWSNPEILKQVDLPVVQIKIDFLHDFDRHIIFDGPSSIIQKLNTDFTTNHAKR